jgi:hypothetical protein
LSQRVRLLKKGNRLFLIKVNEQDYGRSISKMM